MKKFELYTGIAMIVITTALDILYPMFVEFSATNLALICILSAIGYIVGYLFIDSHICRVETHYYLKGFDEATALHNRKSRFNLSKNAQ